MPSVLRGNQLVTIPMSAQYWDPSWNAEDRARFLTLSARLPSLSPAIIACMVWKRKFPGLQYDYAVEKLIPQSIC
jgi:hypothetical protein